MNAEPRELARLTLLVSALAGRPVDITAAEPGVSAWTDGAAVFIAPDLPPLQQQACAAVQGCLLGAGSFDPQVIARLRRKPAALGRRYLAVEGHRALLYLQTLLPAAARALLDPAAAAMSDSPCDSLSIAESRSPVGPAPAAFGEFRARQFRGSETAANGGTAGAADDGRLQPGTGDDWREPRTDEGARSDDFPAFGRGGAVGRLLKRMLLSDGSTPSSADGPPGLEGHRYRATHAKAARGSATLAVGPAEGAEPRGPFARGNLSYPEWDVRRGRYRPDWCTVVQRPAPAGPGEPLAPPNTRALRRPLAGLGAAFEQLHRQPEGDDIDLDAAIELHTELAAGATPDEAVYLDSQRRRRDLSVLILLDLSGSASQPSTSGVPVHELQRAAAAALTLGLHEMGDRVALLGFRSQGRGCVEILAVKEFGDRPDAAAMQRMGALVPGAYTRLGAAIRHGTAVIEETGGTSRRLLVVISDGFAYDHGYEGSYGEADARQALAEARHQGIASLCLTIGAPVDSAAMQRVFGTSAHAVLDRTEQLAFVVGPLFRRALRAAESQRRIRQRHERSGRRRQLDRPRG